jgi:hypothetical protein
MAEEETRKVTILWEVEDNTRPGLDSVARRQREAQERMANGVTLGSGRVSGGGGDPAARAAAAAAKAATVAAKLAASEQVRIAKAAAAEQAQIAKQLAAEQAAQAKAAKAAAIEQAAAAKQASTEQAKQVTAHVAALEGQALALKEQREILKVIGGEEKQIFELRQKELSLLRQAALAQGSMAKAAAIQSQAKVERITFANEPHTDMDKLAKAAEKSKTKIGDAKAEVEGTTTGVRKLAEQAQSMIGKFSGMAGAAGVVLTVIGAIAAATIKLVKAQDEVEKKLKAEALLRRKIEYDAGVSQAEGEDDLRAREQEGRNKQEQRLIASAEKKAKRFEDAAALIKAEAGSEREVLDLMVKAQEARANVTLKVDKIGEGDIKRESEFQIKLLNAEAAAAARERRPDLVRASGEGKVQQLRSELEIAEALAKLSGTTDRDALKFSELRRVSKLAELDLELKVLNATTAQDAAEQRNISNRKAQIGRDADLINIEARIAARRIESQERERASNVYLARLESEGRATARVIDLESARASKATEQAKTELDAAARIASLTGKREDLLKVEAKGERLHSLTLAQLAQEASAVQKQLDIREAEIRSREAAASGVQFQDELEQVAHDRKLARADAEMAVLRAADAEQARLAAARQARVQQIIATANTTISTFENIQGSVMGVTTDALAKAQTDRDADLEDWKTNLTARTKSQSDAFDRQIESARGNSSLVRDLERRKLANEKATQKKIEAAELAHNNKRQLAEMRFQGIMLLVQAAVQTAKAAAAYPVIPSMVAHGIAAGINAGYGIALLAGKVPGAGPRVGAGGGGGSTGSAPSQSDRGSKEVNRVPESVGGRAAERQGGRGRTVGGQSGNVTFAGNVTINALGSIDEDAATKIGMAVNQGKHIREGAAIK